MNTTTNNGTEGASQSTPSSGRQTPFRIAIVDNDRLVLGLLASFLAKQPHLAIDWTAQSGQGGIDAYHRSLSGTDPAADLIVTDIAMHGMSGLEMCSMIRFEDDHTPILGATSYDPQAYAADAMAAGMQGMVMKDDLEGLLGSITTLLDGGRLPMRNGVFFNSPQQAYARLQAEGKPVLLNLSENERTVMDYLAQGMLTTDIAMLMDVRPSTVKTYVSRAMRKLGVNNRREAVAEWSRITNQ
ncbi:response regulator transcription factor [Bifidobacterium pseudolongum]|uniref:response regulator transcription factor n=1 Tax=Bifidobacterium pseudolongum TaxID=1694 RepID=UPI0013EA0BFC|nr:response regulator transcription factor [Bifidobacterium pseudolongum]